MPAYYRKRISNQKGFRLNLHGSKKGLGASYSLHTKKKKGQMAVTWNSKRGFTLSIHGTGLRWQSSQKGKGKTGKTREQISADAKRNREAKAAEKARARREREAAAAEKRRQKAAEKAARAHERKVQQIINNTNKIAEKAIKRTVSITAKFEKFDEQIDLKIEQHEINTDNYDGSEEKLINLFSENYEIQLENENKGTELLYYEMAMVKNIVLENQEVIKQALLSEYGVLWQNLSGGRLSLLVSADLFSRLSDNTNNLDNICNFLVVRYLNFIFGEYLNYCLNGKELSDTVCKELVNLSDGKDLKSRKAFVKNLCEKMSKGKEIAAFTSEKYTHKILGDDETDCIKCDFLKDFLCCSIETIEKELKEESNYKEFFLSYYDLVAKLAKTKTEIEKSSSYFKEVATFSDDDVKNLEYLLIILADSFSQIDATENLEIKIDEIKQLTNQLDYLQVLSSVNKDVELSSLAISYLVHLIGHLENEKLNINVNMSFEKIEEILNLVKDLAKHINFNSKLFKDEIIEVRELLSSARITLFETYTKTVIDPLVEKLDENNILESDIKEYPKYFNPLIKLLEYISPETERFRDINLAITDNGMKEFQLCAEYLDTKIMYVIELYAACAEEINDNIENDDVITLTKKNLQTLDLKEDLTIVANEFSKLTQLKSLDDITSYVEDLQLNIVDLIESKISPKTSKDVNDKPTHKTTDEMESKKIEESAGQNSESSEYNLFNSLNDNQKKFVVLASKKYGIGAIVSRDQINEISQVSNMPNPKWFKKDKFRQERGKYLLPLVPNTVTSSDIDQGNKEEDKKELKSTAIKKYQLEDTAHYLAHLQKSYYADFLYQPDLVWSKEILEVSRNNNVIKQEFNKILKNNSFLFTSPRVTVIQNIVSFFIPKKNKIIFVYPRNPNSKLSYLISSKKLNSLANDIFKFILPIYNAALNTEDISASTKASLSTDIAFLSSVKDFEFNNREIFEKNIDKYNNYKKILVDTITRLLFNPLFADELAKEQGINGTPIKPVASEIDSPSKGTTQTKQNKEKNFFETRVTEYQTKGTTDSKPEKHTFKKLLLLTLVWFILGLIETSITSEPILTSLFTLYLLYRVVAYIYHLIKRNL